jgi:hypothetical protein
LQAPSKTDCDNNCHSKSECRIIGGAGLRARLSYFPVNPNEAAMLIPCTRFQASFADPMLKLELKAPAPMIWDEHGGTFVLKVANLTVADLPAPPAVAWKSL